MASAVAPGAESVPQAPEGLADPTEKVTGSPLTALPAALFTVAVSWKLLLPSAGTLGELGLIDTELGAVWVMWPEPDAPVSASLAVTVQVPAVLEAV